MSARNTDPETSHAAAEAFSESEKTVDNRILELARATTSRGITQAQAVDAMPEYKPGSITPRFVRLVRRRMLVRVCIGTGKPTKCFPKGRPLHITRVDGATGHRVLVHWVPEFAPTNIRSKAGEELVDAKRAEEHTNEPNYGDFESIADSDEEYHG